MAERSSHAAEIARLTTEMVRAAEGSAREEVAARIAHSLMNAAEEEEERPACKGLELMPFGPTQKLFALNPEATALDLQDQLNARLGQLSSMLSIIHGTGFETFDVYNATIQEQYLSMCANIAHECETLHSIMHEKIKQEAAHPASAEANDE